jgi:molybdopterin biosynthesis enzyme
VKKGEVVAGTRTIPVLVKEELIRKAEALCSGHPIVQILAMPERRVHLIVTGSEVYTGRIQDGFEPVVRKKLREMGSDLADKRLATDDPEQIADLIRHARNAEAELILVSGGCLWIRMIRLRKEFAAAAPVSKRTVFLSCPDRCF